MTPSIRTDKTEKVQIWLDLTCSTACEGFEAPIKAAAASCTDLKQTSVERLFGSVEQSLVGIDAYRLGEIFGTWVGSDLNDADFACDLDSLLTLSPKQHSTPTEFFVQMLGMEPAHSSAELLATKGHSLTVVCKTLHVLPVTNVFDSTMMARLGSRTAAFCAPGQMFWYRISGDNLLEFGELPIIFEDQEIAEPKPELLSLKEANEIAIAALRRAETARLMYSEREAELIEGLEDWEE